MKKPRIGITMGDPAGVGPELCLKLAEYARCDEVDFLIYGNKEILDLVAEKTELPPCSLQVVDHPIFDINSIRSSEVQPNCGQASYDFVTNAIDDALNGTIDAIVTCPLNKAALESAGIYFPGHTEILVAQSKATSHAMMLTGDALSASLVTAHVGICDIPKLLSKERIIEVAKLSADVMSRRHNRPVKLGILGLNPHAGEGGLFGEHEEERIISPAIEALRDEGYDVTDPIPPDTAFLPSMREKIDCYICMYHDQGLIPLKTLCFEEAVNVTLGLPIIRTSVDHGTAYDIAWQGVASPTSLYSAVDFALSLLD